jgi:uncharacterized RDD family membrane protein YckC
MSTDFKNVMSKRTDEELIKIVTIDRGDYQPLAVIAAEEEIQSRNLDITKIEDVKSELNAKIEQAKQLEDKTVKSSIRFLHLVIETTIWLIVAFILTLPLNAKSEFQSLIGFVILISSFICYFYFMEVTLQKTVGKFVTKTKVVTNDGNKATKGDIFIRTLCRLIPFDQFSFLFMRNGFHDKLSNTKVIKDKNLNDM